MPPYRHTQFGTVTASALGAGAVVSGLVLLATWNPIAGAVSAVLFLCLALFHSLTVEIDGEELRVWFGPGLSGQWKFYPWPEGADARQKKNKKKGKPAGGDPSPEEPDAPPVQLYDLSRDIGETTNVAADHPEVAARLQKLLEAHLEDLQKNMRPPGRVE